MIRILKKLFPKTCESLWLEGYEDGLQDGFENAKVVAAWDDVFILPHRVSNKSWVSLTGGNA